MSGTERSGQSRRRAARWSVAVFVLAALPRLFDLAAFVNPDERRWLSRSVDLLRALQSGDLSLAYHSGNPAGIVTKWLGLLGLWGRYLLHEAGWRAHLDPGLAASRSLTEFTDAVRAQPQNILDVLPAARAPVALVTALMVVAAYLLARRLWGQRAGLACAAVLVLDPFFVAHSRMLHQDALVAGFMMLSVLSLAAATAPRLSGRWCALAGVLAGLGALSKPTALFLAPWALAWLAWNERREIRRLRWLLAFLAWAVAAAAVYCLAWPAMWVAPWDTLIHAAERSVELAEAGHNQFFFGRATSDPGLLFYPVVWLLRSTPIAWLGLAGLAVTVRRSGRRPVTWPVLLTLAFAVAITFSAKKNDRYLLPAILLLDVGAGLGLAAWFDSVQDWARPLGRRLPVAAGLSAATGLLLLAWHHPYYLTYYNPLAGGGWLAPRVLLVGWGEGLDAAGRWLSGLPDASRLSASSYYRREFSSYFPGTVRKLADDEPQAFDLIAWHASDYVVSYVSQRQTGQPDDATSAFLASLTPEHVVRLRGIDYAWIYRTPRDIPDALVPASHILREPFGDSILLLGHDDPVVTAEPRSATLALYWQCLSPTSGDYLVRIRLIDSVGTVQAETEARPYGDQYPTSRWPGGAVVRDVHSIALPVPLRRGDYRLAVALADSATGRPLAPRGGDVIIGPLHIPEELTGTAVETTER